MLILDSTYKNPKKPDEFFDKIPDVPDEQIRINSLSSGRLIRPRSQQILSDSDKDLLASNMMQKKNSKLSERFPVTELKPTKQSQFDIGGPINSATFVKHSETRRLIDDYNIVKEIGEGAYGKVKLVSHKKTGIQRAAKFINRKHVKEEEEKLLFDEVSILMKLDHPNIIRIFHVYQEPRSYVIVTELCSGGELFERIQKSHSFSEKQAAELMK